MLAQHEAFAESIGTKEPYALSNCAHQTTVPRLQHMQPGMVYSSRGHESETQLPFYHVELEMLSPVAATHT